MSRERRSLRFTFVPGVALLPEDFGVRLARLKEALGLTWEGFASMIGVDYRQMLRWRKKGAEPAGGAMLALVDLAVQVPGGLDILLGRDLAVTAGGGSKAVGRQQWVYRLEPSRFPEDFPQRLERFKEASGLSWRGLARELRVDIRQLKRWRKGTRPDPGNVVALFGLAARMGLLHLLLPEAGEPVRMEEAAVGPG